METCDYCYAIGACPRCWGRAGIEELKAKNERLLATIADVARVLEGEILAKARAALAHDQ